MILGDISRESIVKRWVRRYGWTQSRDVQDGGIREMTWEVDRSLQLHYLEEARSGACLVQVTGEDRQAVEELAEMAARALRPLPLSEIIRSVDEAKGPDQRARALLRLGLAAPDEFDARIYSRLNAALHDPDARIREAAIGAIAYSHWPHFRSLVEYLSVTDPDERVRRDAEILFEVAYEAGRGNP